MRFALLLLGCLPLLAQYDVLIREARVVDGTGAPWFRGDVAVQAGRIAAVGRLAGATARQVIEARGRVVAPGFIDIHSHGDRGVVANPGAESSVRQGVTTLIAGNDGSSPLPLGKFLDDFAQGKRAVNLGFFVGQGTIRTDVVGVGNRAATGDEIARMAELAKQAMLDGAFGLSTGLFYVPGNFSSTPEVVALAKAIAPFGGMHISHMRNEAESVVASAEECIRIGELAGIPTQLSHHKIIGKANWGASRETLRLVEEARRRGVDVTIDQYPYTASSTGSSAVFPRWSLAGGRQALLERLGNTEQRARIKAGIVQAIRDDRGGGDPKNIVIASCRFDASLAGKSLADIARSRGLEPTFENAAEIAIEIETKGGCSNVYHAIGEEDVRRIMASPYTMVASDGEVSTFGEGVPHPRGYGAFARVLGRYVREQRVLTLEEAVRRMTSLPAARLKMADRGLVRPGMMADLVVLDPDKVIDKATFEQPHQYAEGVSDVLVNGAVVLRDGQMTGERPGQVLRGPGYGRKGS